MEYVNLGDVATYINGYAFKPEHRGKKGLPIIRIQDLNGNSHDLAFFDGKYPEQVEINTGDILISWSGSLGVYKWNKGKALLNQHIFKVIFNKIEIDKEYFCYAIRNSLSSMSQQTHGATMKHITKKDFDNISIPYPDLIEQKKIANNLNIVNKLIMFYEKELILFEQMVKARFVEMFGEPVNNPKKFEKRSLKDTCKIVTGNTPSRAVEEYYGDFVEWIKTDNIISGEINPTRAVEYLSEEGMKVGRVVEEDAILMACIAGSIASIGRVCVTDRTVAFNQQINAIVPYDYNQLFLYVLLQISKDYLIEDVSMALKGILSKSKLEEKEFVVPPIELQNQCADFVRQVDKSREAVKKSLEKTQQLYDSLMQEYFG